MADPYFVFICQIACRLLYNYLNFAETSKSGAEAHVGDDAHSLTQEQKLQEAYSHVPWLAYLLKNKPYDH